MNAKNNDDVGHEDTERLSGAEHFLVGVSPQYWAHTPLSIQSLHNLGLVDGIDCLAVKSQSWKSNAEERNVSNKNACKQKRPGADDKVADSVVRFIPVSKCEIQGVIVNADQKSNGSNLYLLDDGTGVVDCVQWVDNAMYSLPSLVPQMEQDAIGRTFRVGDIVRVLGKVKCVSIGRLRESINVHGREWKVHECVREVHITTTASITLNSQSNHWLRCIQFERRACLDSLDARGTAAPSVLDLDHSNSHERRRRVAKDRVRNGPDVLHLLGSDIGSKALERANFPAPDDSSGAWRVFGAGCRCDLPYLNSLLYCHCQATVVNLDPHFQFRDAVLDILLQMESEVTHSTNALPMESCQLAFQYKAIVRNDKLQGIAAQVVMNESNVAVSVDRLFLQTFAALRKDGIVSLVDDETDTYLLVSRERVLEPHCKKLLQKADALSLEKRVLQSEQPAYLKNVPAARLQYVKKTLTS